MNRIFAALLSLSAAAALTNAAAAADAVKG